jgi:excisionase family DNA binding protein
MSDVQRLSYTRDEAAEAMGVSKDTITRAVNAGALRAKRTGDRGGGKYLISSASLLAWFDSLQDA